MSNYCKDPSLYRQLTPRLLSLPGAEPQGLVADREMRELGFILVFYLVFISTEDQPRPCWDRQVSVLTSTTSAKSPEAHPLLDDGHITR